MSSPIIIELPHNLGTEEVRRRIDDGISQMKDRVPGGPPRVESVWEGDRMNLNAAAMGQEVSARIEVYEARVHLEVVLPPMLGLFGNQIEAMLRRHGAELLADKKGKGEG